MKVWVTRDKDRNRLVCMWDREPEPDEEWFTLEGCISGFVFENDFEETARVFKKDFGFTPKKGSCEQYELTLTKVKK